MRVLGVDFYDPIPGKALAFADELGLTYPQIADPEAATRAPMRVQGLPMTVFVDEDGEVDASASTAPCSRPPTSPDWSKTYLDVDVELG